MTGKITKAQRQILLLIVFSHVESIIDLDVIKLNVPTDIRTLQRDIKELTAAGFLKIMYNRKENRYSGKVFIPRTISAIDDRKRGYFEVVRHYEKMIFGKTERYCFEPEYRGPIMNKELSADRVYFKMFPNAREDDFKRDVRFLREIGFPIDYCERLKIYYIDFPEKLEA